MMASTSCSLVSRNEATGGGTLAAIAAICCSEITPGPLGIFDTNPSAAAPCPTASLASVRLEMQQIFTLGRVLGCIRRGYQNARPASGLATGLVRRVLRQALGFPLFDSCLRATRRAGVDLRHPAVRLRLLRSQLGRFSEIVERIGILPRALAFPGKSKRGAIEQIRSSGILRIELMCVAQRFIALPIFTQFQQNGSVQEFQLKQIG